MLSILILTHNRPKLFRRALYSILNNLPDYPVEILVNNDTKDIREVPGATYYYEKHEDLSETYKFLLDKASYEFVYYLEDDDYILPAFFESLDFDYDINFLNYKHENINEAIKRLNKEFEVNERDFQLGQLMFKKSLVNKFPKGNIVENDWVLFKSLKGTMKLIPKVLWVQTTEGGDNISFPSLNVDNRFSNKINKNEIFSSGRKKDNTLYFTWLLTNWCNYSCSYCSTANTLVDTLDKEKSYSVFKLVIQRLRLVDQSFVVEILGGEPSIHKDILEILRELNSIENCIGIELITNLSRSYDFYSRLSAPEYSKVELTASYHYEYHNKGFIQKLLKLKKLKGINLSVSVNLPTDSRYWKLTAELLDFLEDNEITIMTNFLHSTEKWESRYPADFFEFFDSYFEQEYIEFVLKNGEKRHLREHEIIAQQLNRYKGYKCRSLAYDIDIKGVIARSCNNELINFMMTNLDKEITCPVLTCDCYTLLQFYKESPK